MLLLILSFVGLLLALVVPIVGIPLSLFVVIGSAVIIIRSRDRYASAAIAAAIGGTALLAGSAVLVFLYPWGPAV
jgi:hypothetical protein